MRGRFLSLRDRVASRLYFVGTFCSNSARVIHTKRLIHDKDWLAVLDELISFRGYLRDQFRIHSLAELKANWLLHRKGDFKNSPLSFDARMRVYRSALRFQRKCGKIQTFAIVIHKHRLKKQTKGILRSFAWTFAIQRLERFGRDEGENVHVLPDEGHGPFIKRKLRQMRRFNSVSKAFGTGWFDRKAENILEDSSDRKSHESYFIQLADLNAYAASRHVYPGAMFGGSYWEELGDSRIKDVNKVKGGPRGIVSWPRS